MRFGRRADAPHRAAARGVRRGENGREIQPPGFPVVDRLAAAQPVDRADHVVEVAEPQLGHDAADFLGDERQVANDVFRLAGEAFSEFLGLRGDSDGARAQVALAHEDAAQGHEGRGAEAEAFGAEHGPDHDVAAGPHLAVHLDDDAVAKPVEHERLLRFGQSDFPGRAGVFDRRQGAGAGAAVVAADEHFVGVALGHARRHRAHAHLGNQLHRDLDARDWRT